MSQERTQRIEFGKDFEVAGDWLEFSGQKPARPAGINEHVYLVVEGYEFDPTNLDNLSTTIEINGQQIEPMVRVIDSNGDIFPTCDTTRWGKVVGLKVLSGVNGTPITTDADKVRIAVRSDQKFLCKSIGWNSHRMK